MSSHEHIKALAQGRGGRAQNSWWQEKDSPDGSLCRRKVAQGACPRSVVAWGDVARGAQLRRFDQAPSHRASASNRCRGDPRDSAQVRGQGLGQPGLGNSFGRDNARRHGIDLSGRSDQFDRNSIANKKGDLWFSPPDRTRRSSELLRLRTGSDRKHVKQPHGADSSNPHPRETVSACMTRLFLSLLRSVHDIHALICRRGATKSSRPTRRLHAL